MPLPYKVAKSLDPVIYRNTAFDSWLATKKGYFNLTIQLANKNYKRTFNLDDLTQKMISMVPGNKCLYRLNNEYRTNWAIGIVQNIANNLATVIIPEMNLRYY